MVIAFLYSTVVFSQNSFDLLGDAAQIDDDTYRLTRDLTSQSGVITNIFPIDLTLRHEFDFDLFLGSNDSGADGITFILTDACQINNSVGGGLGVGGFLKSLFVEFDTYRNGERGDPFEDHISIMKNGSTFHNTDPISTPTAVSNLENGQFHNVKITCLT